MGGDQNGMNAFHIATGKVTTYNTEDGNIFSLTGKAISCGLFRQRGYLLVRLFHARYQ
jgi:hypothetical protein